jgi:hypothetical protein
MNLLYPLLLLTLPIILLKTERQIIIYFIIIAILVFIIRIILLFNDILKLHIGYIQIIIRKK